MSLKDKTVGFLGAGNMGEAIIKGLLQTGLVPTSAIAATDARADRLQQMTSQYGIRAAASNLDLVAESDVVILAVKPQIMGAVLKEIAGAVDRSACSSRWRRECRWPRCARASASPRASSA